MPIANKISLKFDAVAYMNLSVTDKSGCGNKKLEHNNYFL